MTTPEDDLMARYLADYRRHSVPAEQLVRVRARLEADLVTVGTAGGHGLASSLRAWWLVGVLAVGALAGWVLLPSVPAPPDEAPVQADEITRADEPDRETRVPVPHELRSEAASTVVQMGADATAIEAGADLDEPTPSEASKARAPRVRESSAKTDATANVPDAPAGDFSLARQLAILKQARRELSIGRPRAALDTLEGYARDVPEPLFEAERLLLTAIAQCDAGVDADARVAIEELELRFPGHALLARARRVCRTSDERQSSSAATTDRGR